MCEANVYLIGEDGEESLVMEAVDKVIPEPDSITLESIYYEKKVLHAKILEMALLDHRIVLTPITED
jgi:predicted RNA-binding protein